MSQRGRRVAVFTGFSFNLYRLSCYFRSCKKVRLRVKSIPWFVSDTIRKIFVVQVDRLSVKSVIRRRKVWHHEIRRKWSSHWCSWTSMERVSPLQVVVCPPRIWSLLDVPSRLCFWKRWIAAPTYKLVSICVLILVLFCFVNFDKILVILFCFGEQNWK